MSSQAPAPETDATAPPPSGAQRTGGGAGRIIGIVLISLVGLFGLAILLGGLALVSVHAFARDDDGFYEIESEQLVSDDYAIATNEIVLGDDLGDVGVDDFAVTVRFGATGAGDRPVFIGIASRDDAERYLEGVAHAEVTDIDNSGPVYVQRGGAAPKDRPADDDFWVASAQGSGEQTVEWKIESGDWKAVAMNADASRGVDIDVDAGARVSWLIWVGVGLTLLGLLVTGLAAFAILRLTRQPRAGASSAATPT